MENRYEVVRKTSNYSMFKILQGNRGTEKGRVSKIINSINDVGYIMNPIIVNEKMEVIDGQGRLAALEELGLPVYYLIVPKAGIRECISMNINQEKWTTIDYIKSYAERGNPDYILLKEAFDTYYPELPQDVIKTALLGQIYVKAKVKLIETGAFTIQRADWRAVLRYLDRYTKFKKGFNGSWSALMRVLLWAYDSKDINRDVLYSQFEKYWGAMVHNSVLNIDDVLDNLEKVYNYRKREKTYIKKSYDEFIRGKLHGANSLKCRKSAQRWGMAND